MTFLMRHIPDTENEATIMEAVLFEAMKKCINLNKSGIYIELALHVYS